MTIAIKISTAEAALIELLVKVEAGEDIVFARGFDPVARLTRVPQERTVDRAVDRIRTLRRKLPKTTIEEIVDWKNEDRR